MSDSRGQDLDLTFLYEIADGSNEFIVESIDMFLQHTPALLQEIDEAIKLQNWTGIAAAAHKLKPNVGFFGMLDSQALSQDIEYMAKSGQPDIQAVTDKFEQLQSGINSNLNKLNQIKAEAEAQL